MRLLGWLPLILRPHHLEERRCDGLAARAACCGLHCACLVRCCMGLHWLSPLVIGETNCVDVDDRTPDRSAQVRLRGLAGCLAGTAGWHTDTVLAVHAAEKN